MGAVGWHRGRRARATVNMGAKPPYPLTERGKWMARGGRRAAMERCMGAKGQELWVNMGPSPHTPFIGKRKPLRIKIKILFIYIWPAKTQDHANIYSLAKRFLAARAEWINSAFLSSAHFAASTSCTSIYSLAKRFSAARAEWTNSAFLSSARFAASTNCASICLLAKRFSAARTGLTNSAFPSFGCENRKSPQNRIKIPAMQILSARNGTGGFFT